MAVPPVLTIGGMIALIVNILLSADGSQPPVNEPEQEFISLFGAMIVLY